MEKTLADTVADLEKKLDTPGDDENLGKALDVAALALGGEVKPKRGRKKVEAQQVTEAKGEQETTTEQLLKSLLEEDDDSSQGTPPPHLGKAITLADGRTAVDASEIVLAMDGKLDALALLLEKGGLPKKMLRKAITAIVASQQTSLEEELGELKKGMSVMCRAMKSVIDRLDAVDDAPIGGSKFDGMEKSFALAKAELLGGGGTPFPMTKPNMERLAKARLARKVDDAQMQLIKKTGVLPAGVDLN